MSMESTESAITTTGDLPRKGGRAFETHPGLETIPGTLRTKDGARLRTIVTRPAGTRQRLPGVLFVQWLSCDSIELPESADDGWSRMLKRIARESDHSTQMWCNARVPAIAFYQKHGWQVVSDEFPIEHAGPHVKMTKSLEPQMNTDGHR